ncbi:hypothetical protein GCM10010305_02370 [Streptomyces termitum]|uniref:Uncharacterized protein n=1 Tax=Streptomyces termitum TaxID=67368 RepID=A0A918W2A9_9ACTN|nr:hypothetical protein GCM10010305_02370 [Streptomyces termitum]
MPHWAVIPFPFSHTTALSRIPSITGTSRAPRPCLIVIAFSRSLSIRPRVGGAGLDGMRLFASNLPAGGPAGARPRYGTVAVWPLAGPGGGPG